MKLNSSFAKFDQPRIMPLGPLSARVGAVRIAEFPRMAAPVVGEDRGIWAARSLLGGAKLVDRRSVGCWDEATAALN